MTDEHQSQRHQPGTETDPVAASLWMRVTGKRQAVRTIPITETPHAPIEPPSVDSSLWVHEPDEQQLRVLSREALKSYSRPLSGPLAPFKSKSRFSRWRSSFMLAVVVILTLLAIIGAVRFGQISIEVIKLLKPVATHTPFATPAH